MKTVKFYEVHYEGHFNGLESNAFESIELAKEFAKNSKGVMGCSLHEVTMVFNGTVTKESRFISGLRTPAHDEYIENEKWQIEIWKKQIAEIENNKRMKAENKVKQIANFENCIARKEKSIKEYYETYK